MLLNNIMNKKYLYIPYFGFPVNWNTSRCTAVSVSVIASLWLDRCNKRYNSLVVYKMDVQYIMSMLFSPFILTLTPLHVMLNSNYTLGKNLPPKIKTQYVHFRSHTKYFLLMWIVRYNLTAWGPGGESLSYASATHPHPNASATHPHPTTSEMQPKWRNLPLPNLHP